MRQMSKAQHFGKLVLRVPDVAASITSHAGGLLLSGGMGALGALVTLFTSQKHDARLFLTGRFGRSSGFAAASAFNAAGVIHCMHCDVSNQAEGALLSRLQFGAAMHISGTLADGILLNQTVSGARRVFSPKCSGIDVLQRSVMFLAMARLVVFSSISSLLGNAGQANCA
jgi:hypothetical protein